MRKMKMHFQEYKNRLTTNLRNIYGGRFCLLTLFFSIFIVLSFMTRTVLLIKSWHLFHRSLWLLIKIYSVGFLYDVVTMLYFAIPLVLFLIFVPDKVFRHRFHKPLIYLLFFVATCIMVFDGVAEYFFFYEFGTRFNFIAIDYLVYTRELVKNMKESYPLLPLFSGMALLSLFILLYVRKWFTLSTMTGSLLRQRLKFGAVFLLLPVLPLLSLDSSLTHISSNNYANELSANGIYNLFAAFKNNQIDYRTFYASLDDPTIFNNLKTLLREKNNSFSSEDLFDLTREIRHSQKEKRLNIVVVVVESLSSEYLGVFGNRRGLTPNLDRMAEESLFFTNLHATGTRTDRGLEAITLSVPPTPGRSIVKRPDNEDMFSWGRIMKERGYDVKFIYAGYGYFDNMNYFFSHNGFETVDRKNFSKDEITFENAWGVCDEDLYHKCIREFDKSFEKNTPFFALILTTSNHRPFTYPGGRIDIPSHSGRNGAVKYTDYAIGKFLRDAKAKPWFEDTLFVIVADHCAGSAGKTALPVKQYEIPLFIYSPAHVIPQTIDKLASQIDIAPTTLGLLNFNYRSKFFGKDILIMEPEQERAFIGTYEKLGYMKKDRLVVLDVKKEATLYQFDRQTGKTKKLLPEQNLIGEAISYYQGADHVNQHHLNRRDFNRK